MKIYDPDLLNVEGLLENNIFEIPVYQRPYSWTREEVEDLLNDIYDSFLIGEPLFMGTIYTKTKGNVQGSGSIFKHELIDGQQRIISLALLFLVVYSKLMIEIPDTQSHELIKIKNILWKYVNRKQRRDLHLVHSNSIEKEMLVNIFETAFDSPKKLIDFIKEYETNVTIETNIVSVINSIVKFVNNCFEDSNELLDFINYVLLEVNMIVIFTKVSSRAIFNMFEAINSKGKKLEDIDLIKSFIFSKLDDDDHQLYLKKWGQLIKDTNDNLGDYLWVYVKAFVKYYVYSIKVKSFKSMIGDYNTTRFFGTDEESLILKELINDLLDKSRYYKALDNLDEFEKITTKKRHLVQFNIFNTLKYEHPKPIVLRALYEYDKSEKNKDDQEQLELILKAVNSYMVIFQTMNKRDSKDSIPLIQKILNDYYTSDTLNAEEIRNSIVNKLISENLVEENFRQRFFEIAGYRESATDIGFVMLAIYQAYDENNNIFSDNNANAIFKIKNELSIDHLLAQKPDKDSEFSYYMDKTIDGREVLKLKDGSDFPKGIISGMPYNDFKYQILSKMGNLRFMFKDSNSSRGNQEIVLKDDIKFTKFKQVEERQENMVSLIMKSNVFLIPTSGDVSYTLPDEEDYFILDFNNPDAATGNKPVLVSMFDNSQEVNTNKEMVKVILGYLYSKKPQVFDRLIDGGNNYGTKNKPWITTNPSKLRNPEKIEKSNLYFEANKSAVDFIKMIYDFIVNEFQYDINNFEVLFKINKSE